MKSLFRALYLMDWEDWTGKLLRPSGGYPQTYANLQDSEL